jgi:hypothetical protein
MDTRVGPICFWGTLRLGPCFNQSDDSGEAHCIGAGAPASLLEGIGKAKDSPREIHRNYTSVDFPSSTPYRGGGGVAKAYRYGFLG